MKKNTTRKGDLFEERVFELINDLLQANEFFVPGNKSEIFHKKSYFSKSRDSEIIFDIAIETSLNNAPTFSLLTIIECKDNQTPVAVSELEEFAGKLNQIGPHRTKGVFITTSCFQSGAVTYAKSMGISLVIVKSNNEIDWVNYRINSKTELTKEQLRSVFEENNNEKRFIAYSNNKVFEDIASLLLDFKVIDFYTHKERFIKVPYRNVNQINEVIDSLISQEIFYGNALDSNRLCQVISEWYDADFIFDKELTSFNKQPLLGKISFDPLTIYITKSLKDDVNRWRFTLAHEIGHLLMHKSIFENVLKEREETEYSIALEGSISKQAMNYAENQANVFAGGLLMPYLSFYNYTKKYFLKNRIYKGYMYVDSQPQNYKAEKYLLEALSKEFIVSKEAARIRLRQLKLLRYENDFAIGAAMRNMGY